MRCKVFLSLIVLIILVSITGVNAACPSSMIAYWKFNENSGNTARDVIGNNDITCPRQCPSWGAGKIGSALIFDGVNDKLTLTNINYFKGLTALSLEAWAKFDTNSGNHPNMDAIIQLTGIGSPPGSNNVFYLSRYDQNRIRLCLENPEEGCQSIFSNTAVSNNVWHHIVATWDGTTRKIYIDGQLDKSDTWADILMTAAGPLYIGADADFSIPDNDFMDGSIDEVAVYNRALTQQDVINHWNSGNGRDYCEEVTICTDSDGDGYGNPGDASCPNGAETDCDDSNASIHPNAVEICNDDVDNDCNSLIDCEDTSCVNDPSCGEICDNGVDDDSDSLIDCADTADCCSAPVCISSPSCGCQLNRAYWSTSAAIRNDIVSLTLEGAGCNGLGVNFTIWESDLGEILCGGDDIAVIQPIIISFSGNIATTTWTAELDDCNEIAEYYFNASLISNPKKSNLSAILTVHEVCAPRSCEDIEATEGKDVCGKWDDLCGGTIDCSCEQGDCVLEPGEEYGYCVVENPYCSRYTADGEDFCNNNFDPLVAERTVEEEQVAGVNCGSRMNNCDVECVCYWTSDNKCDGKWGLTNCFNPILEGECILTSGNILKDCDEATPDPPGIGWRTVNMSFDWTGTATRPAECVASKTLDRKCIKEIMLGFFDNIGLVIAILLIVLFYLIILRKRKKFGKRKTKGKRRRK